MRRAAQCLFRTLETTRHFTNHAVVVSAQTLGIKCPTLKSLGVLDNGSQLRGVYMKGFKFVALAAFVGCAMIATVPKAPAQIAVEIGVAPECPYGYYDAAPYDCAPYGYYGPEWFTGGVFLGAGPWFHGPENFQGHVNNRFHPEHGYTGPKPQRGEKAEPSNRLDKVAHFKGNEVRDGRGHAGGGKR
jgi:hypothetical protein